VIRSFVISFVTGVHIHSDVTLSHVSIVSQRLRAVTQAFCESMS
jgi:hypothetical protein